METTDQALKKQQIGPYGNNRSGPKETTDWALRKQQIGP